jgi:hypothetical protein
LVLERIEQVDGQLEALGDSRRKALGESIETGAAIDRELRHISVDDLVSYSSRGPHKVVNQLETFLQILELAEDERPLRHYVFDDCVGAVLT